MHKESQKKFLWLDPNRWSGQKTVKKEKVNTQTYSRLISQMADRYDHDLPLKIWFSTFTAGDLLIPALDSIVWDNAMLVTGGQACHQSVVSLMFS